MLIEAILRFKHARVMQVLRAHNLTVKKLAEMAGWKPVTLGAFLRFQHVPKDKSKYPALFEALQMLDPAITYEEVFPECLKKAVEVFSTQQRRTAEVDVLQLTDHSVDMLALEDHSMHTDNSVERRELKKELWKALRALPPIKTKILAMHYGLGNNGPKTLEEVGRVLNLSRSRIKEIRDRALLELFKDPKTRKILYEFLNEGKLGAEDEVTKQEKKLRKWLGYVPRAEVVAVWSELTERKDSNDHE